ncbi:MAG: PAS domain-containing protein, partial [Pseudanabaena sp. CAN_BIN31]|nr:PAS domain-containing protein [Pseudanabaena sp. CAN_BIN31]
MNRNGMNLMEIDDFSCWVGKNWVETWQEPYHSLAVQAIEDAKNGDIGQFEGFYPTAKGTPKWWDVLITAVPDADGSPLRLIATSREITTSKQIEERLRKSDTHLKTAQRIVKLGSWEFDPYSGEIIWSDQVFRIFGRDPILGTPTFDEFQQNLHPDDRESNQQVVETAIANCQSYENEVRFYRGDGSLGYFQSRGEPVVDDAGELVLLVGTVLDITDRKLAETKLMQTTTQLAASNRELEAFAYSVSHDLRSPLRAIDGFSKALLEDYGDKFDQDALDYFDRIRSNVARMGNLIEDLLRLSRVSRSEMQYKNVNLSMLVSEQFDELQAINPERQVEIAIAPNVIVSADITLMRVIISNLIQNAWKFTSNHATARIEFGVIPPESKSDEFIYFVRDDGAGFNMDYANNLFGVFQRLHNTNEFAGTGIGLATVQRAIHRHDGKVWAEGAIEQGATIYFTVPDS